GRDLLAVSTAIPPRAKLVPSLDLIERAFLRVGKLDRVGRVAQEVRILGGLHGNAERGRHRDRNRSAGGINRRDNPATSPPLPVFAIASLLLRYVGLLHYHDRERDDRVVFAGPSAHQHAVAYLDLRQRDGRGRLQVGLSRSEAQNPSAVEQREGYVG